MPADPDDAITRRRRQRADRQRLYLLVGAGALAGLVLGCCGGVSGTLLLTRGKTGAVSPIAALTGPSENREGREWTLVELRDYLGRHGWKCRIAHFKNSSYLLDSGHTPQNEQNEIVFLTTLDLYGIKGQPAVEVVVCDDQFGHDPIRAAREMAGREQDQGRVFAWGRFYFKGDPERLAPIRAALR